MDFTSKFQALNARIKPFEKLLHLWSESFSPPLFYHSGNEHYGFRYAKPDFRHFCLLKAIRAVSALNAACELAYKGYAQEIAVLIRTIAEYTTHIEYVLHGRDKNGELKPEVKKYIESYFSDFARNNSSDFKRPKVQQGAVHEMVGGVLDTLIKETEVADRFSQVSASKLFSNIYLTLSNYVHARYPEVMDMYGGNPRRFHLQGMSRTPKDEENFLMLNSFTTTVSHTLRMIVLQLKLYDIIRNDEALREWYSSKDDIT